MMLGGGPRAAANPGGGLPFAGVPAEMQAGVDRLLAGEPVHEEPVVRFTYGGPGEQAGGLTLRRLVGRHRRLAVAAVALVVVVAAANQAGPELVGYGINHGMVRRDMAVVLAVGAMYLLSVLVTALAQRSLVRVTGRLAAGVMNDLRVRVFAHLQRLGLDFYTAEKAGVVMTRMTSDIENLQQLLQDGLSSLAVQALTMVVIAAVLFSTDALLALVALAMVVPALTAASVWFQRSSGRAYDQVRDRIADVLADLSENLHGIRVVASYNRQALNTVHHRDVVACYRRANDRTARINALYGPGTSMLGYLASAGMLAIGGEMVLHGSLTVGGLTAFVLYLNRFMGPIQLLVQQYNVFQQGQSSLTKLRTLFAEKPNVSDKGGAPELPLVSGRITLAKVSFGYGSDVPVLNDIDLEIRPGETVGFVGPTGAGKSTIAKLVTRFYDPTSGQVLIDGHDLRDVTIASLRRQLGVVPQEPFLFAGTVRDNVAFARPGATDAEIWEALRAVGLAELVERMAGGLDTVVHERGSSLSSGERQLLALARAFMARPRVLVLDEATSNLDLASEAKIEAALDVLLQGRTAVLIAHRLSTAMRADRIVVVDGGRIVEAGSHAELVQAGGRYAAMYATWTSHGATAPAASAGPPA